LTGAHDLMRLPFLPRFLLERAVIPHGVGLAGAVLGSLAPGVLFGVGVVAGDMAAASAITFFAAILVMRVLATRRYPLAFATGLRMTVFIGPAAIRVRRQGGNDGHLR
jgi:hypothetical protein